MTLCYMKPLNLWSSGTEAAEIKHPHRQQEDWVQGVRERLAGPGGLETRPEPDVGRAASAPCGHRVSRSPSLPLAWGFHRPPNLSSCKLFPYFLPSCPSEPE